MSAVAANVRFSHRLVGESPAIQRLREQIPKIALSRSPVLLLGETGSGKEVVARAIYEANPAGNFVPIDCGSLVGTLMESELFGHAKGSFTGAGESKKGLIELANGGTAFFDEIGDLPLDLQVKLLRVLQEREYRPVGSLVRHKVDLRVVAATHRNLAKEVERGNFREDLYYRLNVIRLVVPPLRERKEDIPLLIDYFLQQLEAPQAPTPELTRALSEYDWPGNVRELYNCVQRMVAVSSGPYLHTGDLPTAVRNHGAADQIGARRLAVAAGAGSACSAAVLPPPEPAILTLAELERRHVRYVLQYAKGDRTLAAHLLGIGRTTLYRKIKEYGLAE
jgi:DNA-binding NtrC family response regulator